MKTNYLLYTALIIILASCSSAYRSGQTPDDVYYSAGQDRSGYANQQQYREDNYGYSESEDGYVVTNSDEERNSYNYRNDLSEYEIRRGIRDRRYRNSVSLYLGFGNSPYYMGSFMSPYYNPFAWNSPFYGGYYNSWYRPFGYGYSPVYNYYPGYHYYPGSYYGGYYGHHYPGSYLPYYGTPAKDNGPRRSNFYTPDSRNNSPRVFGNRNNRGNNDKIENAPVRKFGTNRSNDRDVRKNTPRVRRTEPRNTERRQYTPPRRSNTPRTTPAPAPRRKFDPPSTHRPAPSGTSTGRKSAPVRKF